MQEAVLLDLPAALEQVRRRDRAIESLVIEGAWAETPEERARILGVRD